MDIHKPKPWHGFREFLKEYLIIVVGVLTALAAEGVAERVREMRLSSEGRDAVRAEVAIDLANEQRRSQWQPCIDRRLSEVGAVLQEAAAGKPLDPVGVIGNPGAPLIATKRWEAAAAGGRTSLLSLDEQRDFARVYTSFQALERYQHEEQASWEEIEALRGVAHPSSELLAQLQLALARARYDNFAIRNTLRQTASFSARMSIRPTPAQLATVREQADREMLCLPLATTPAEAAAKVRDPLGPY